MRGNKQNKNLHRGSSLIVVTKGVKCHTDLLLLCIIFVWCKKSKVIECFDGFVFIFIHVQLAKTFTFSVSKLLANMSAHKKSCILIIFALSLFWCQNDAATVGSYQVIEWNNTPSHPMGPNRHACDRVCVEGEPPMTCKYQFTVEVYSSLGRVMLLNFRLTIFKRIVN